MNKNFNISDKEKRAIVNYLSDEFSVADSEILNHWLANSKENKLLLDQFSDIWKSGNFKKIDSKINLNKAWNDIQNQISLKKETNKTFFWREILRYAAVFVIAIFLGGLGYYYLNSASTSLPNLQTVEYVAPLGSRSFVQLADGSKVWLNAGSTLKYQSSFGISDRDLFLSGEAFFEVEKNKEVPFIVKTSEIDIVAIGTKFNVKAYSEENTIETTLIEGLVKLESSTVKLQDNLFLKPNEKAVFTKKNPPNKIISYQQKEEKKVTSQLKPKLEVIKSVEPEPIISWKEKRWIIHNEKLGDLAVRLERRYDVNFIFDNEQLKEYSFGGKLEDETLEQVMEAISFTAPIKYVIDKKMVYIKPDEKRIKNFKNLLME